MKMINTWLSNPQFEVISRYASGHQIKRVHAVRVEISNIDPDPMQLIMDYMLQQINAIDEARKQLRIKYPNFLPEL